MAQYGTKIQWRTKCAIGRENSKIFNLFAENKAGVTRNVIIDKKGNIAFLTRLFERNEFNEMKNKINNLLNN